MLCNIFLHFRSKLSKVTRWSDLGSIEGSALLHQRESTVQNHPIKTCKHTFVLDTNFTCDNWVT